MRTLQPFCPFLALSLAVGGACTPSSNSTKPHSVSGGDSASEAPRATTDPEAAPDEDVPPDAPVANHDEPVAAAPAKPTRTMVLPLASGPYRVRVVDDSHHALPTYAKSGRRYVLGTVGDRYAIEITNPTARRVEAVVSVDGLDAMDGHPANYAEKRGYILPAHDTMTVDGFRTSYFEVATFRFSPVADSYAGRLGEARDVGIIGVAFFPEQAPPEEPLAATPTATVHEAPTGRARPADGDNQPAPAAPPPPRSPLSSGGGAGASSPTTSDRVAREEGRRSSADAPSKKAQARAGLGTEFGEARESRITSTWFLRENATRPSQVVALRYNNRAGLVALGIPVPPPYVDPEVGLRETADPFRENRFAQAPP